MQYTPNALKHLFLQQSYLDAWEEYEKQIHNPKKLAWDYVILTASNEQQAECFREQIRYRKEHHLLPEQTTYAVLSDPNGKRVGSGGATFNVLAWLKGNFAKKRIMVIHSGGDSKRIPQYSVCGKLFSPVPRELPNGMASTLFDEFMIATSMVAGRIEEGMLVMSGDVLLLFNALQIDAQFHGAAAISMKEDVEIGKNHGVFLGDGKDGVKRFLHKQSVEHLQELGAVNQSGKVDLDTGAVLFDCDLLEALYSLISTEGKVDSYKFDKFVNESARISFYGDFLYPLAQDSTLEAFYEEAPEGTFCPELKECRTMIWDVLHEFTLKLICLSPAEFIHFGTTRELQELLTGNIYDYDFLGWNSKVCTNWQSEGADNIAVQNSLIAEGAQIGEMAYLENSYIHSNAKIGKQSIISNLEVDNVEIPEHVVLHGVKLLGGEFVVRIYGIMDNPKSKGAEGAFLDSTLGAFLESNKLKMEDFWDDEEDYLWFAKLYPVSQTIEDAINFALIVYKMSKGTASETEIECWKNAKRESLYSSFNSADETAILPWQEKLKNRILVQKFLSDIKQKKNLDEALSVFVGGINEKQYKLLMEETEYCSYSERIRIFYALAKGNYEGNFNLSIPSSDDFYDMCFQTISDTIYTYVEKKVLSLQVDGIKRDKVDVSLPVRVNWGGGWTDTPPYCLENGGVVLNAAISLRGELPIKVSVHKINEYVVELESQDIGVHDYFTDIGKLQNCRNPYDQFALHKAALIACGIIPLNTDKTLEQILRELGGGIYLSTQVIGIPKGSGLGTSSILAGACVKALFEFMGKDIDEDDLYDIVLCMEQLMSTGGGWQDQVGGLTSGVKFITTKPGVEQHIQVQHLELDENVLEELNQRFALIYTGQRRLARNLLRDVVGSYIRGRDKTVDALAEMGKLAALMKFELERGDIDAFAQLLNKHWKLSVQMDAGSTNTCIEQIFLSCQDMIAGRFIAGAGGGGFLQVILKKGVTKEQLRERLKDIFQDSGVDVWDCAIIA